MPSISSNSFCCVLLFLCICYVIVPPSTAMHFDDLQDLVGHYCGRVCRHEAKLRKEYASYRGKMMLLDKCTMFTDRIEHMIVVSGNDALRQLYKPKEGQKFSTTTEYYREAIARANYGKHNDLLKVKCMNEARWMFDKPGCTKEQLSEHFQPSIGQWLLNIAAGSDPTVTTDELSVNKVPELEEDFEDL